jgi:thiol-disulfide isomerase/thioredoxin
MIRTPLGLAIAALLYGAICPTANAVAADLTGGVARIIAFSDADRAELKQMRSGDMSKLIVHDLPLPRIEAAFDDSNGNPVRFADYAGKVVLLNFWATWCPPCRAEMPSIDRLAGDMAGDDFAVIALSSDRGGADRPTRFFQEIGIKNLDVMLDSSRKVAREAGILGLPVTLILDRQGREIARLIGDAEWDSPEAKALLGRVIELTGRERA